MARDFESRLAGGVHLLDVSSQLPTRRGGWRKRRKPIERIYLHHSGKLGAPGFEGLRRSAQYSVRNKRQKDGTVQQGWPGTAYHYWVPYHEPAGDVIAVYRANPDSARSYHTGGQPRGPSPNDHGLSVVLQGDLRTRPPSHWQIEALEALVPWLQEIHRATLSADRWLSWHSESGAFGGNAKPTCPGPHVEAWAREWRGARGKAA